MQPYCVVCTVVWARCGFCGWVGDRAGEGFFKACLLACYLIYSNYTACGL